MLQLSNSALFALALQRGSGATDSLKLQDGYGNLETTDARFNYFPLMACDLAPVKLQDVIPDEIGGRALPSGAFVTGAFATGPASIIARLSNRFGWLLYATMGEVSTVSNVKAEDLPICDGSSTPTSGVHSHVFRFLSTDQYFLPWLTMRRMLPHGTAAEKIGETYQDGHIAALTLNVAAGAPLVADMNLMARLNQSNYVFTPNPAWTATFDDYEDFAVANCDGHFKINTTELKVTACSVTVANRLLPPQGSIHVGSVHPLDFPNLGRICTITANILVEDYDLYVSTFAGATTDVSAVAGSNVACTVYQADVDVMVASQTAIGAAGDATEPYRLRIISNTAQDNVAWQITPIRVRPRAPVVLQATATVMATETGDPLYMILQNGQNSYPLPA